MSWWHAAASAMDATGNMAECYQTDPPPPPDTVKTEGIEYRWPAAGNGTSQRWKTTFGNPAKQYDPLETSERPPSDILGIPQERCTGFEANRTDPPFTGTFTRTASTVMHLKSDAPAWPKLKRSVVLACSPTDMTVYNETMLMWTAWSTGHGLGEPNTWYWETGVSIDPAVTPIVIDGERTNPDGSALVEVDKVWEKPVTPDVQDAMIKWYRYGLSKGPIKPLTLTWSAHPQITGGLPDLQVAFDAGARLLAKDNDGPGNGSDTDDVTCYMEFFILKARAPDWSVTPAGHSRYNQLTRGDDLEFLRAARMSNIKLVTSIKISLPPPWTGHWQPLGYAVPFSEGMVLVATGVSPVLVVHEYGHICDLGHRTNTYEAEAIMYEEYDDQMGTGTEVNASEAGAFQTFRPVPWHD